MKLFLTSLLFAVVSAIPLRDADPSQNADILPRQESCKSGQSRCLENSVQQCENGQWGTITPCPVPSHCTNPPLAYCSIHCSRMSPGYPSFCDGFRGYWYCSDPEQGSWQWKGCTTVRTFCYGFGVRGAGVTCMGAPMWGTNATIER